MRFKSILVAGIATAAIVMGAASAASAAPAIRNVQDLDATLNIADTLNQDASAIADVDENVNDLSELSADATNVAAGNFGDITATVRSADVGLNDTTSVADLRITAPVDQMADASVQINGSLLGESLASAGSMNGGLVNSFTGVFLGDGE